MKKIIILNSILIFTIATAAYWAGFVSDHRPTPNEIYSILSYEDEPSQNLIDYCNDDPDWCMDARTYDNIQSATLSMMIRMPDLFNEQYLEALEKIKKGK